MLTFLYKKENFCDAVTTSYCMTFKLELRSKLIRYAN